MPRVSYIKAMDVYLGVCFCIVFFSLIKLAVVKYMRQRLRITRDTSIVAGMMPMLRLATNGFPMNPVISQAKPMTPTTPNGTTFSVPMAPLLESKKETQASIKPKNSSLRSRLRNMTKVEFSPQFMRRFHWMSQASSFPILYLRIFSSGLRQKVDKIRKLFSKELYNQ